MSLLESFFQPLIAWIEANRVLVWSLAVGSAVMFVGALLLIPWLVLRIPPDYFSAPGRYRSALLGDNLVAVIVFKMIRNILAVILVAIGILLLVLPGQGVLTILLGVVMADFPGKHRLMNWLVSRGGVLRSLNWWRRRAGKPPIEPPPRG